MQAEPNWTDYYIQRATFYRPRWYGTRGQWQKDLAASADGLGGDKGDMLYARVIWRLDRTMGTDPLVKGGIDETRVQRGFACIQKQFPEAVRMTQVEIARLERAKSETPAVSHTDSSK